ncbi:Alpha/Beta hydrolase protein [Aspergillus pseudonomiae]|uniref:Alpha/Beta hydrolase protein n=1 Tax=Aspergillus pseudonomiae TaxID=1506151 RepID=A0A5N7DTH0_9EURO|nr:Alpha/Beta hydrolase protein [Aspergillus pseudonomiae]KAE8409761.1 Alpha/Beta hydrolase protein [Aspergillus pseudonomiae]
MGFRRRKEKLQPAQGPSSVGHTRSTSLYTIPTAASTVHSLSTASTIYSHDNNTTTSLSLSGTTLVTEGSSTDSSGQYGIQDPNSRKQKARRSLAKYRSYADLSNAISQTKAKASDSKLKARSSVINLEQQMREYVTNVTHSSVDLYGSMLKKLDDMITSMDEGLFRDKEDMVTVYGDEVSYTKTGTEREVKATSTGPSFFSKTYLYHNSRLPAHLPPVHILPQTYALIRLAAQYSSSAYKKPAELTTTNNPYVSANIRHGTKAMVIKPLASDDLKSIVLAIRGTQSFRDWAVNMKTLPTAPQNFLDDPDNLCHAGFLTVAQRMAPSVAAYLRDLLTEDPNRASYSLILTGHSAGGAVASLLYCHLLSTSVSSELKHLASFFGSIHCVTFGAPPVSIRPLFPTKSPASLESMFYAFINEGDPVPRAEKSYVTSLLNLYLSPAPFSLGTSRTYPFVSRQNKPAIWRVPPATLHLAGNVVLLRHQSQDPLFKPSHSVQKDEIEACQIPNEIMHDVVFGDPVKHWMGLYQERIEHLARRSQQPPPYQD